MTARRADFLLVIVLAFIFIILYLPVWSSEYLYTDEAVQLWFYGKEPRFEMFGTQGRYITEKLFAVLFGSIQQVKQVMYIRFFSFSGWFATLPIFYFGIKKIVVKEGLPGSLAFLTVLFIICSPTVSISIAWASCLELFLANVCGFLSGYFFYQGFMRYKNGKLLLSCPYRLLFCSALFPYLPIKMAVAFSFCPL